MFTVDENETPESGAYMIIPFSASSDESGMLSVRVGKGLEKLGELFEKKYSYSPFSDEAKEYAATYLSGFLAESGYRCYADQYRENTLEYLLTRDDVPSSLHAAAKAEQISPDSFPLYKNLTEFEPDAVEVHFPYFCRVESEAIAAIAAVNEIVSEGEYADISVETAEDFRGRGYAKDCVSAISRYLISEGFSVGYVCTESNKESERVALSCGFRLIKKGFDIVFYSENERDI